MKIVIAASIGDRDVLKNIGDLVEEKDFIYIAVKERPYHKITLSGVEKALQTLGDYCRKKGIKNLSFDQFDSGRLGSSMVNKQIKLYVS